jgi:hypothetical protein
LSTWYSHKNKDFNNLSYYSLLSTDVSALKTKNEMTSEGSGMKNPYRAPRRLPSAPPVRNRRQNAAVRHRILCFSLLLTMLLAGSGCHRYALPSPKGPPQPKVKKATKGSDEANADGSSASTDPAEMKIEKNSYDKKGLLKKPKYERRKRKKKVGQRTFLGSPLPF